MSIFPSVCGGYAIPGPAGPGVPANGAMMVMPDPMENIPISEMSAVPLLEADYTFGDATTDDTSIIVAVPGIYRVEAGAVWSPQADDTESSDRRLWCTIGSSVVNVNVGSAALWPTTVTIARSMYVGAGEVIGNLMVAHTSQTPEPINVTNAWLNAFLIVGEDDLPGS